MPPAGLLPNERRATDALLLLRSRRTLAVIVLHLIGVICDEALRQTEGPCDAGFHAAEAVAVVPLWQAVKCLGQNHSIFLGAVML